MINNISDKVELNNGIKMPWLGLGVMRLDDGKEVEYAIHNAFEAGYRSIDTAVIYGNENGVSNAIENSGLKREEIFLTSKIWNSEQGYNSTLKSFDKTLTKLGVDYLDLYLIHWPVEDKFKYTWRALEKLYEEKLVRSIGVSNFMIHHLEELFKTLNVVPAINQIEFHPYLTQPDLIKYCNDHLIQVEAWSPIMKGTAGNVPEIVKISNKYNKTPTQVVLRWELQKKIVVIPKSTNKNRIIENAQIFDFELEEKEITILDSLDRNYRFGGDPYNFDF